ncbi:hypothetical protein [Clostridium sp. Marseille-P299]|uniref:hypothetical protein n=1 Tax=Clostridium sp. Marseille-P299 TaxID=1805477 RepID=UPI0008313B05|nr:hypothetical protein [Clostridium sp. Marseille-P299]
MKNIKRCMYIIVLVLSVVYIYGCDKKTSTENTPTQEENLIDQENKVEENNTEPLFTDVEIKAAIAMAEEHIDAMNQKDNELIMKTMYPEKVNEQKERIENGEVQLYGVASIDIESIEYLGDDHELTQMASRNYKELFGVENILPLYATINVQYPEGVEEGEWAEGELPNFCFLMIREDENSPFYVYDKGF